MYGQLMEKIAKSDDVDIAQLFSEDRQPLRSPMDKDKRRAERVEIEDTYINVRRPCSIFTSCLHRSIYSSHFKRYFVDYYQDVTS